MLNQIYINKSYGRNSLSQLGVSCQCLVYFGILTILGLVLELKTQTLL